MDIIDVSTIAGSATAGCSLIASSIGEVPRL